MSRRIIIFIFIIGLTATFFLKPQAKSNEVYGMPNFTVITRTSTPVPQPPTATPSNPNPTSPPNPSQSTATPIVTEATATPTLIPVTLVATPVGGFLPTAVSCGVPPTIQAKNTTRVRLGPGTNYAILGQLVYLETRPIVGRSADSEWWIVQFSNSKTGWVANTVVNVQGNTSGIPTLTAPPLNGETPTPGPLWNPTPNSECPILPTATPTVAQTATPTEAVIESTDPPKTATPRPTKTATPDTLSISETTESAVSDTEATPEASATSVVPSGAETAVTQRKTPVPTASPLAEESSAARALPCAPALIGLAVIGFLAFRRIF